MDQVETNALLRRSWALAVSDRPALSRLFYAKLFQIAPETERLFVSDLTAQGKKLAATLAFIIDNIDDMDTLLPVASDLAIRHVDFNVTPDHYGPVGAALIETLRDLLGAEFDTQTEQAWAATYGVLSQHMIDSAYGTA
ncbi:MAG: globin domain-containing protein [Pseudomonadota bacterium]